MLLQPNATTRKLVSERVYEGTGGNNLLTTATLTSTDKANHALVIGGIWVTQASIPTGMFCEGVTLWTLTRMVVPFRSDGSEGSNRMLQLNVVVNADNIEKPEQMRKLALTIQ